MSTFITWCSCTLLSFSTIKLLFSPLLLINILKEIFWNYANILFLLRLSLTSNYIFKTEFILISPMEFNTTGFILAFSLSWSITSFSNFVTFFFLFSKKPDSHYLLHIYLFLQTLYAYKVISELLTYTHEKQIHWSTGFCVQLVLSVVLEYPVKIPFSKIN